MAVSLASFRGNVLLKLGPACVRHAQFPTPAADPQPHGARQLETLEDAFARITLEEAIDKKLEELKNQKGTQSKQ